MVVLWLTFDFVCVMVFHPLYISRASFSGANSACWFSLCPLMLCIMLCWLWLLSLSLMSIICTLISLDVCSLSGWMDHVGVYGWLLQSSWWGSNPVWSDFFLARLPFLLARHAALFSSCRPGLPPVACEPLTPLPVYNSPACNYYSLDEVIADRKVYCQKYDVAAKRFRKEGCHRWPLAQIMTHWTNSKAKMRS